MGNLGACTCWKIVEGKFESYTLRQVYETLKFNWANYASDSSITIATSINNSNFLENYTKFLYFPYYFSKTFWIFQVSVFFRISILLKNKKSRTSEFWLMAPGDSRCSCCSFEGCTFSMGGGELKFSKLQLSRNDISKLINIFRDNNLKKKKKLIFNLLFFPECIRFPGLRLLPKIKTEHLAYLAISSDQLKDWCAVSTSKVREGEGISMEFI